MLYDVVGTLKNRKKAVSNQIMLRIDTKYNVMKWCLTPSPEGAHSALCEQS